MTGEQTRVRYETPLLGAILTLAAVVRIGSWWRQGLVGGDHSEFEAMARLLAAGEWTTYLASTRPHQPVYALLLTPRYLLDLDLRAYVFTLHLLLACGTVYLVYRTARALAGPVAALGSALLVAVNLMAALWFPWTSGDIVFHFFLALFAWSALRAWRRREPRRLAAFAVCAGLCALTRPEGIFPVAVATLVLAWTRVRGRTPFAQFAVALVIALVTGAGALAATLYFNRPVREAFFSSIHVAYPLFISTRMSTNSPQEQEAAYNAMSVVADEAQRQPGLSPRYALSMEGLRFIREHPGRWARMYVMRLASVVFPSVFSPWWSVKNRLYNFTFATVLVGGALLACWLAGASRAEASGLALMGASLALAISLFQREMDHRVPISIDIVLSSVAPFGWLALLGRLRGRHAR